MPWKLIAFLAVLLLITVFIGFNLDNRCDVSLIFYKYRDVPIFVSLLFAYAAGAITVIPFFLVKGVKRAARGKGSARAKDAAKGKNPVRARAFDDLDDGDFQARPGKGSVRRRKGRADSGVSDDYETD